MPAKISSYHAHIYYDPATTRHVAETVRAQIAERFSVRLGRWHDVPVGPHPRAMFQVAILPQVFVEFFPWLLLNRAGLAVLIHPNTGQPRADDTPGNIMCHGRRPAGARTSSTRAHARGGGRQVD